MGRRLAEKRGLRLRPILFWICLGLLKISFWLDRLAGKISPLYQAKKDTGETWLKQYKKDYPGLLMAHKADIDFILKTILEGFEFKYHRLPEQKQANVQTWRKDLNSLHKDIGITLTQVPPDPEIRETFLSRNPKFYCQSCGARHAGKANVLGLYLNPIVFGLSFLEVWLCINCTDAFLGGKQRPFAGKAAQS